METARIDFDALQQRLETAVNGIGMLTNAVSDLTKDLKAAKNSSSVGEQWVRTWGETAKKKDAAHMLGISVTYLGKLIGQGDIRTAPDGRVLVRAAAEWANSRAIKRPAPRWRV